MGACQFGHYRDFEVQHNFLPDASCSNVHAEDPGHYGIRSDCWTILCKRREADQPGHSYAILKRLPDELVTISQRITSHQHSVGSLWCHSNIFTLSLPHANTHHQFCTVAGRKVWWWTRPQRDVEGTTLPAQRTRYHSSIQHTGVGGKTTACLYVSVHLFDTPMWYVTGIPIQLPRVKYTPLH